MIRAAVSSARSEMLKGTTFFENWSGVPAVHRPSVGIISLVFSHQGHFYWISIIRIPTTP